TRRRQNGRVDYDDVGHCEKRGDAGQSFGAKICCRNGRRGDFATRIRWCAHAQCEISFGSLVFDLRSLVLVRKKNWLPGNGFIENTNPDQTRVSISYQFVWRNFFLGNRSSDWGLRIRDLGWQSTIRIPQSGIGLTHLLPKL